MDRRGQNCVWYIAKAELVQETLKKYKITLTVQYSVEGQLQLQGETGGKLFPTCRKQKFNNGRANGLTHISDEGEASHTPIFFHFMIQ